MIVPPLTPAFFSLVNKSVIVSVYVKQQVQLASWSPLNLILHLYFFLKKNYLKV